MDEDAVFWEIIKDYIGAVSIILAKKLNVDTGGLTSVLLSDYFKCENTPDDILINLDNLNYEQTMKMVKELENHRMISLPKPKLIMENKMESSDKKIINTRDINLYLLAWLTVIGFYVLVGILMWRPIPEESSKILYILLGSMSSGFTLVLGYFFGSSKGSSDKSKLLTTPKKE